MGTGRPSRPAARRTTASCTASGSSTAATASATTSSGASCGSVSPRRTPWPRSRSIRAARPDGAPIYVILDNLSAHKGVKIRAWAARNKVELCFTPTYASWANPIEAQFGPLRTFVIAGSNHPNHPVLARKLHAYLRWRNANARHPDVLAAQRRERARIRSERQHRWGQTPARAAA